MEALGYWLDIHKRRCIYPVAYMVSTVVLWIVGVFSLTDGWNKSFTYAKHIKTKFLIAFIFKLAYIYTNINYIKSSQKSIVINSNCHLNGRATLTVNWSLKSKLNGEILIKM